jgi:hypothetical protein
VKKQSDLNTLLIIFGVLAPSGSEHMSAYSLESPPSIHHQDAGRLEGNKIGLGLVDIAICISPFA